MTLIPLFLRQYEFAALSTLAEGLLVKEADRHLTPSFNQEILGDSLRVDDILQIIDLGKRFDVRDALPKAFYILAKSGFDLDTEVQGVGRRRKSKTGWCLQGLGMDDGSFLSTTLPSPPSF